MKETVERLNALLHDHAATITGGCGIVKEEKFGHAPMNTRY